MTTAHRFPARRRSLPWILVALLLLSLSAASLHAQTDADNPPAEPSTAAPAAAAAPVAAPPPQAKPLLILRGGDGKMMALRARAAAPGASLLVETLDGAAQTLDAGAYVNQLPWYTGAELESGRVDLNALAIRYRAFGGLYPQVQATLYAEAQHFRDVAERLKNAGQQRAADTQKRVADFLALRYDPAKNPPRGELAAQVREADELARLAPAEAAQIARAAAPMREGLAKLDAGQTFYEGKWLPAAEVEAQRRQREEAAIAQTFDQTLGLPLDPLALSWAQLLQALAVPVVPLLLLLIPGLALLAGKRRGLGVLLVAAAVAEGVVCFSTLSQDNSGGLSIPSPDSADARTRSARVVRLLYRATLANPAAPAPEERTVRLTNQDLSSFVACHAQPAAGSDAAAAGGGLRRDGLAVGVTPDGFTLFERVAAAGQTACVRYDVKLDASGGAAAVGSYSVKVGGVTLPSPFKEWFWARIAPALGEYIATHRLLAGYALEDMSRGEIRVSSTRSAPAQ